MMTHDDYADLYVKRICIRYRDFYDSITVNTEYLLIRITRSDIGGSGIKAIMHIICSIIGY